MIRLKDLSFWGWFKLQLFMDLAVLIVLLPIIFGIYFITPSAISYNGELPVFGLMLSGSGLHFYFIAFLLLTIGYLIKSLFFYMIFRINFIGNIVINRTNL